MTTKNRYEQSQPSTVHPLGRSIPEGRDPGPRHFDAEYMRGNARDGQTAHQDWPDLPAPITAEPEPQSPYPVDAFPGDLAKVIAGVQRLAQTTAAIAGAAVLGALALLVQRDWRVQTLAPHPSPAGLYLVAMAESGLHKTTAFGLTVVGHQGGDTRLQAQWKTAVKRGAINKEDSEEMTPRSSLPVALLSEFTTDGLLRQLQDGRPSVASWEAEAGTIINAAFSSNRIARTMGYLSKSWESGALLKTLADGEASTFVPPNSYALSIVWGGAPEVMAPVIFGRDAAHGFMARCLISWDDDFVDPGYPLERDQDLVRDFNGKVLRVREVQDHGMEYASTAGESQRRDRMIRLSTEARDILNEFYRGQRSLASRWRHNGQIHEAAFAERAPEHAARIAGVWTGWDAYQSDGLVPDDLCSEAETMERAVLLVDWYQSEVARVAPATGVTLKARCAEHLAAMIAKVVASPDSRQGTSPLLNERGVLVNSVANGWGRTEIRSNPDFRREVIRVLVDHGYIRPSGFKGRYEPHPEIGSMYSSF